jgi:hypothetical protein
MNTQIFDLHEGLHKLVSKRKLYYSMQLKQFVVLMSERGTSHYQELDFKLTGLIYEMEIVPRQHHINVAPVAKDNKRKFVAKKDYPASINPVKKLFLYGECHTLSLASAMQFAALHHSKQIRKSNHQPYMMHLFEVLNLIKFFGKIVNGTTLIASVLHDVVEDTHVTIESIEFLFGSDVASIVAELTCENAATSDEKKQILLDKIKTASASAKIIKLADVISNISSIPKQWTDEKKTSYLGWCDEVADVCKTASENLYHVYIQKRPICNFS